MEGSDGELLRAGCDGELLRAGCFLRATKGLV